MLLDAESFPFASKSNKRVITLYKICYLFESRKCHFAKASGQTHIKFNFLMLTDIGTGISQITNKYREKHEKGHNSEKKVLIENFKNRF